MSLNGRQVFCGLGRDVVESTTLHFITFVSYLIFNSLSVSPVALCLSN